MQRICKMNKYSLKDQLKTHLEQFQTTLKASSLDTENRAYLCNDETTPDVYDFDKYIKQNFPHPTPASPDAIHVGKKDLYFVEFKNQKVNDIDKGQLQKKFESGTQILNELLMSFAPKDCQYHFCVVFKNPTIQRYFNSSHIESNVVKFGLSELNSNHNNFYDKIYIEPLSFYIETFKALDCA